MKFLFALLGVALAASSGLLPTRPFRSNQEYHYIYDGILASGLPISAEGSVTRLHSDVFVQLRSDRSAVMQMRNLRLAASHGPTEESLLSKDSLEKREISSEHEKLLQLPVAFAYREGLISELQFSEDEEQPWSANIKRAVLNMLQVNLNQPENSEDERFFTLPEKTMEGDCNVAYSVNTEGEKTMVTKAINFEKCSRTPEVIYGRRFSRKSTEHQTLVPQSVFTYKFVEEKLEEVTLRSTYTVLLKDEPVVKTEVEARLVLSKVTDSRKNIEIPRGEKQDLLYSNEWEMDVEKFFKGGEKLVKNPFVEFNSKIERASEVIRSLKDMEESHPEMVHEMARLVRILRMCTVEELDKIHEKLFEKTDSSTKRIIENALAIAGTRNTIEHLLRHIKKQEIPTMSAAKLLKSIQETQYPSEEIAKMIAEFAKHEVCREEPILRQSAWLCYGAVVRGVVAHQDEKHLHEQKSPETTKRFTEVMEENFDRASDVYEKILALKTIANSGLPTTIRILEKIIANRQESVIVRIEAIHAMRIMGHEMPRKIHRVLMPVFADRKEKTEVRAAALDRILYTLPDRALLSQIMSIIERDPNQHLTHYAWTFLKTAEKTGLPVHQRVLTDMQQVTKGSSFRPKPNYFSIYKHFSFYDQQWLSGVHLNLASILGKDSIIPKDMSANLETLIFGRWNQYLGQIGFSHQNIEQLLQKVYRKLEKTVIRGDRSQKRAEQGINLVQEIANKLNLNIRSRSSETPFAMLYFRYKEMDFAMLPIDENIVDRFVEKYIRHGKVDTELLEKFLNGHLNLDSTNAGFLFETTIRCPTSLGLPITLGSKMPTVFTATGKLNSEKISYGACFSVNGKAALTSTQVYQMRIWTPLFEHGVKVVRPTKVSLPLSMDIEMTMDEKIRFNIRLDTPEKLVNLVQMSARPVAFLRFPNTRNINRFPEMEETTIVVPSWQKRMRPIEKEVEVGGIVFTLSGNSYSQWTSKQFFVGDHDYSLFVKRSRNGPREITLSTEVDYSYDAPIEKPSLANREEPEIEGEDYIRELLQAISEQKLRGYMLDIKGTCQAVEKNEFRLTIKSDNTFRFTRFNTEMLMPSRRGDDWKWEQKIEMLLPRLVNSLEKMRDQRLAGHIYALHKWGKNNEIFTKVILEQDSEMKSWNRAVSKDMEGMEEYELLQRISVLNRMRSNSKYNIHRESETLFDNIFDLLRGWGYWNSQVIRHDGHKNEVKFDATVEPNSRRYVNLTIETPRLRLVETNVWSPIRIPLISLAKLSSKVSKISMKNVVTNNAECRISDNKIRTFDEVVYRAPITKCYSVIAKDCSSEASYAVLIKDSAKGHNNRVLKIVKESNEFIFEVRSDKMHVYRNKKAIKADDIEEIVVELVTPKMVVIDLEEVNIRFDGKNVKVLSSSSQMETQCGLCGNYNGDKGDIFRTARDESTEDLEKFHRSYLIQDKECSAEEEKEPTRMNEYRMEEEDSYFDNESRRHDDYSESY